LLQIVMVRKERFELSHP